MTSILGVMKVRADENERADTMTKAKQYGEIKEEVSKRAALGDLQNRGVLRAATGKAAVQKDLNDAKHNALKMVKARVDSHLKKTAPLASSKLGPVAQNTGTTAAAIGQRKIITRSNSVRSTAATGTTSGLGVQRQPSASLLLGQNRAKTLTTKVVAENKLQQVKLVEKPSAAAEKPKTIIDTKLRREDSNLSRKSLTKLKAALSGTNLKAGSVAATASAAAVKRPVAVVPASRKVEKPAVPKCELKIVSVQTHSSKLLDAVEDIDAGDEENLVLVSEYANDIYNYLFQLEAENFIRPQHLAEQDEVNPKMRAVLLDWINEVHAQFHLAIETYQMTVGIIDQYLQLVPDTKRSQLQLVGATALFIAAKYEELLAPQIADFVYITDDSYTARQILQMELKIFRALDCNLSRPLPIHFLRRFSKAAKAEDCHHTMSKYFVELASIEYELAHYKPSEIAAASLYLSLMLFGSNCKSASGFNKAVWTATLQHYSRYSTDHLRPIVQKLAAVVRNAPNAKLKSIYEKYQKNKFQKISLSPELYSPLMDSIIAGKGV